MHTPVPKKVKKRRKTRQGRFMGASFLQMFNAYKLPVVFSPPITWGKSWASWYPKKVKALWLLDWRVFLTKVCWIYVWAEDLCTCWKQMHGISMNFHYRVSPFGKNVEDFDHTPLDPLLPGPIETGEGGRFSTRSWANLGIGWPWKINIEPTHPSKPPWLCSMFFPRPPKIGPHKRKGSFDRCCDSGQLIDRFRKLTIYFAWRWLQEVTLIWWEWDVWACSDVCCKIGVIVANYFHLHNFGMIWKRPEHWKNTQISEPHGVFVTVQSILLMHFLLATLDWWIAPDPAQTTAWLWP